MDLLKLFRSTRKCMSLVDAAELIGVDSDDIYEHAKDVKHVYVYFESIYVVELRDGRFWTIIDRNDWCCDSLPEMEETLYISANQLIGYSIEHEPKDVDGLVAELIAFCANHGYKQHSADELLCELGGANMQHRWYLEDYIERWDRFV